MLSSLSLRTPARYSSLPLVGDVLDGLCQWLDQHGYPEKAIRRRVHGSPLLAESLRCKGVRSFRELTARDLMSLRPKPTYWTAQIAGALIQSLTEYLEERGELAAATPTRSDEVVGAFCRYLRDVRGLASRTAEGEGDRVNRWLQFLRFDARPSGLESLKVADIEDFLAQEGRRLGRSSMQKLVGTMRSFLRFLAAEGKVPTALDAQIDSPRCSRDERLPRSLPWESVRDLLGGIDRSTSKGLRDYAMLLLIATYGLRVSEVAALTLDDISWRSCRIRVPRPKVGTPLDLPLTDEVATALLDYLSCGRQSFTLRSLFLRVRIPIRPIESTAICDVFDGWAARAGIQLPSGAGGPHCLRHSVAVRLLRQGTPVKAIGDLLGHRGVESTGVYLRLNVDDLRDVALTLPTGCGPQVLS